MTVALKGKTFRAPYQPQKVLVVELIELPYPMRRVPYVGYRVDDRTGPQWQVTYSPFRSAILQPMIVEFKSGPAIRALVDDEIECLSRCSTE